MTETTTARRNGMTRTPSEPSADGLETTISESKMSDLLGALSQVGGLKELRRTGWLRVGLPDPESVADHSFRTATLALLFAKTLGVDEGRLVRMTLVHDLAESDPTVGDITPYCGVSRDEKRAREQAAMERICARLPNGDELLDLWVEYAEGLTPEAQAAHEIDALEMALQAHEYEAKFGTDLSEFIESARKKIRHPSLLVILNELGLKPSRALFRPAS